MRLTLLIISALLSRASSSYHGGYTPLEYMVDTSNFLGVNILNEHNFLNENNIAFSPYGLTGILIALYEGVDGVSAYQIRESLKLPTNRDVLRVGFRDIHRRLRSYFIPKEGFLAGLAFNNENVTFRQQYKDILQFYGFDFEMPRTTTTQPPTVTNRFSTTDNENNTTESMNTIPPMTEQTTVSNQETTTTPQNPETTTSIPETTTKSTEADTTTMPPATTVQQVISNEEPETTTAAKENIQSTTTVTTTTQETTTTTPITTTVETTTEAITTTTSSPSTTLVLTESTTASSQSESSESDSLIALTQKPQPESTTAETTMMTSTATENVTDSTEPLVKRSNEINRTKKSLLHYNYNTNPIKKDRITLFSPLFIQNHQYSRRSLHHMRAFLANGHNRVQINYMTYDTVLGYAYLPHLKASALKLPLDTMDYYILIILPEYEFGVNQLIKDLRLERSPSLRYISENLDSTHVRAWVPSFMLKGFVVLTSDLQKIGICDAFEPRQDDFKPMTNQSNIYVRNIEQAITVTIRKYMEPANLKKRYIPHRPPVEFAATHPFLYFVMDSEIHVALMAGKIVNPLNSRII